MSALDDSSSFERGDGDAERLAQGFAEHVVRWAQRSGCDEAHVPVLRRCAQATSLATSNGHVCVLLSELAEHGPDLDTLRRTLLATGVVGAPDRAGSLPLVLDADGRLYLHRYFDYEVRLAQRLRQAVTAPAREVASAVRELLNSLFPSPPGNDLDWQKVAAAMALRGSVTVISGGPGTGKTTTVVNLLACLLAQEPGARIALAAPTGKAAARMTEAIRQRAGHLPQELRVNLPQESFTIHRLLGANPGQRRFAHDAANPIPYDALIVDEASMLDLALATRLLEAVPQVARIVLLGDKDQLAAVEAGAVFAELSADPTLTDQCRRDIAALCGYAPERLAPPAPAQASPLRDVAVWLTKNYRFAAESAIGKLARFVNEGRAHDAMALLRHSRSESPAALSASVAGPAQGRPSAGQTSATSAKAPSTTKRNQDTASLSLFPELDATPAADASGPASDTSIQWLDPEQGDNALEAILAGYAEYFDAVRRDPTNLDAVFKAFNEFRVLCAVREGPQGVTAINEQVARAARAGIAAPQLDGFDARSPWFAGRAVVVARNDYALKLSNGDVGIALPDAEGGLSVFIPDGASGYRSVPTVRMPPHDTAFAMTVHKAQGSEFDDVLLMLPPRESRVLSRELVYTAVTRARDRASIFASAEVLTTAVTRRTSRESGLLARMRRAK